MGKIIVDTDEHYLALKEYVTEYPDSVYIATYGLYVGITGDGRNCHEWGGKYTNRAQDFLNALVDVPKVHILVGLPALIYCDKSEACEHCEAKHISFMERMLHTAKKWDAFHWKMAPEMHMKFFGFYRNQSPIGGITGGRNLSDSDWFDISFNLTAKETAAMRKHFDVAFKKSVTVNQKNVEAVENAIAK